MKWHWIRELFPLSVLAIITVSTLALLPGLPESIPRHFALDGTPDAFMTKQTYAYFIILVSAGLYVLLTFIPFIDPFWKRIQPKYGLLLLFRDIALGFFLFLHILSLMAAHSGSLDLRTMGIGFGLLFILLGNYLPKLPRNWFFGIRVPWTLASEEVWKRTHRLGGLLFVLAGIAIVVLSLAGLMPALAIGLPTVPLMVVVFVYPYLLYRRLQKESPEL